MDLSLPSFFFFGVFNVFNNVRFIASENIPERVFCIQSVNQNHMCKIFIFKFNSVM